MSYLQNREFIIEVAKGNVPGHSVIKISGRNPDVDSGTDPEDLWANGGTMSWPTTADTLDVVSTSADDDGAPTTNTGVQTLYIEGLDGSWDEVSETVTLNGTTPVTTSNSYIRIKEAYGINAGTYHGSNAGIITADDTTTGTNRMLNIPAGVGRTQLGRYSVPNGFTAYLLGAHMSVDTRASRTATITLYKVENANDTTQPYGARITLEVFDGVAGDSPWRPAVPTQLPAYTDIWWEVTEVNTNNTAVEVDFDILLVAN